MTGTVNCLIKRQRLNQCKVDTCPKCHAQCMILVSVHQKGKLSSQFWIATTFQQDIDLLNISILCLCFETHKTLTTSFALFLYAWSHTHKMIYCMGVKLCMHTIFSLKRTDAMINYILRQVNDVQNVHRL